MDNEIRNNLERQFKKLMPEDAPPEQLKEEIFQTLDSVNMIGDIAELFTSQFMQTNAKLSSVISDDGEDEEFVNELGPDNGDNINEENEDDSYKVEEPDDD